MSTFKAGDIVIYNCGGDDHYGIIRTRDLLDNKLAPDMDYYPVVPLKKYPEVPVDYEDYGGIFCRTSELRLI